MGELHLHVLHARARRQQSYHCLKVTGTASLMTMRLPCALHAHHSCMHLALTSHVLCLSACVHVLCCIACPPVYTCSAIIAVRHLKQAASTKVSCWLLVG